MYALTPLQTEIYQLIERHSTGHISLNNIAWRLQRSKTGVIKALKYMISQGVIIKTSGGHTSPNQYTIDINYKTQQQNLITNKKRWCASKAAQVMKHMKFGEPSKQKQRRSIIANFGKLWDVQENKREHIASKWILRAQQIYNNPLAKNKMPTWQHEIKTALKTIGLWVERTMMFRRKRSTRTIANQTSNAVRSFMASLGIPIKQEDSEPRRRTTWEAIEILKRERDANAKR